MKHAPLLLTVLIVTTQSALATGLVIDCKKFVGTRDFKFNPGNAQHQVPVPGTDNIEKNSDEILALIVRGYRAVSGECRVVEGPKDAQFVARNHLQVGPFNPLPAGVFQLESQILTQYASQLKGINSQSRVGWMCEWRSDLSNTPRFRGETELILAFDSCGLPSSPAARAEFLSAKNSSIPNGRPPYCSVRTAISVKRRFGMTRDVAVVGQRTAAANSSPTRRAAAFQRAAQEARERLRKKEKT